MHIDSVLTATIPNKPLPLVFDSPHSGTIYPDDFAYSCDFPLLEKCEDKYVDELFSTAPSLGCPLLCALFPRSYIDVNRAVDDIDPAELSSPWPSECAFSPHPSAKGLAGIGLIRKLITSQNSVYDGKLSPKDILSRIETYYNPYHQALSTLLEEIYNNHGHVWHINCHSMPSVTVTPKGFSHLAPDFVLGDRDGTSCSIEFTHTIRDYLQYLGYKVAINNPYKGVEIVRRYGVPSLNRHSLQLEINRSLYLDENTYKKTKNFPLLQTHINGLLHHLIDFIHNRPKLH